jgi:predicted anti-sigma-YlaC factor YlaD
MALFTRDLICREVVALATDYLELALTRRQRRRFERHLRGCPNCRGYIEQLRITITVSGRADPEALSPEAWDDLIRLYRRYRG